MVTRHRASIICVHKGKLLTVLLTDPSTQITRHFLPGGMIEDGETPQQAAVRETLEETGYQVTVTDRHATTSTYNFVWNGQNILCTTHFFIAELVSEQRDKSIEDVSYNQGIAWLDLTEVQEMLGFHETIFHVVQSMLHALDPLFPATASKK